MSKNEVSIQTAEIAKRIIHVISFVFFQLVIRYVKVFHLYAYNFVPRMVQKVFAQCHYEDTHRIVREI